MRQVSHKRKFVYDFKQHGQRQRERQSERPQDWKSSRCSPEARVAGTEQENTAAADAGTVTRSPQTCEQRDVRYPPRVTLPPATGLGTD